jgi:putative ABC transport system permease protein
VWGAVVEEAALKRMNIALGDLVKVGEATVQVRALIAREPDSGLNAFASLGPRLMMPFEALAETGLLQPGSLVTWQYRLRLPPGVSDKEAIEAISARYPRDGWRVQGLADAGGSIRFWLDRLTQFLGLIGLSSLLVGGVGVGNSVSSFLATRQRTIATMKCLGAPQRLVFTTYFLQLAALAAGRHRARRGAGRRALPFAAQSADRRTAAGARAHRALCPADPGCRGLRRAGVAAVRAGAADARAGRAGGDPDARRRRAHQQRLRRHAAPGLARRAGAGAAWRLALALFTVFTAVEKRIGAYFVMGSVGAFLAFPALAQALMFVAARVRQAPKFASLRLALANLHRPGAPTPVVMLSLGLGLTVLVGTALIQGNLRDQITSRIPKDAPAFFFVDIQSNQIEDFEKAIADVPGSSALEEVPSLRGRIVKIGGKPVDEMIVPSNARWAVDSDRGVTYSATPPEGAQIVAGQWWAPDYRGPQLVSFDQGLAEAFNIGIGDTITVNVLGRDIEAKIASLRRIVWQTLSLNFVFVFSPGILDKAPHTYLATVKATPAAEDKIFTAVTDRFPNVTVVRIRDAIQTASDVLGNIELATRAIGFLSILAGVLVLAGAMLATQRRRVHEAVVMKVLGATRARIAGIFTWEFAALGLATALAAIVVGTIAAYLVVTRLMHLEWTFLPMVAITVALGAMALTLAFGLVGTLAALRQRPLALLRNE